MMERTLSIRVSGSLLDYGVDEKEIGDHVSEWLALKLYTEGEVSSGKAASLLNMTRFEFIRLLKERGIPYPGFTPEELDAEIAAVKNLQNLRQ
jgi:predicted HTH domain antitoxin